jgi:hypothetical protein
MGAPEEANHPFHRRSVTAVASATTRTAPGTAAGRVAVVRPVGTDGGGAIGSCCCTHR